jgi:hypothetical protein
MRDETMTSRLRSFLGRSVQRDEHRFQWILSSHLVGFKQAPPPPRIQIALVFANSTSICQPHNQESIQGLKHDCRKERIRWKNAVLDPGLDPRTKYES